MRTARPDRFTMKTRLGDLPTVSAFAGLLLLVQILVGGFGLGKAAAGAIDTTLCTSAEGREASHPADGDHGFQCPCLSAGCCAAPSGGSAPETGIAARRLAPTILSDDRARKSAEAERRPFALFARAGRGPPRIA